MNEQAVIKVLDLINKGHYNVAEKDVTKLIIAHPKIVTYQNLLAVIYASQKKFEESIIVLEKIIKFSPKFIDAFINLGNIYIELNQLQKSTDCFRKAIFINPNHVMAKFNLACVLDKQNIFNESAKIYENIIKEDPNNIDFLTNYSSNLIQSENLVKAKKVLNKILKIDSNNTKAIINLGVIQKDKGDFKKAVQYFNKALSIASNLSEAFYNLGTVHEEEEKFTEAISSFKQAIKINPFYAEAHYNLGCVLERFGRMHDAGISYKTAIQYKSNYTKALHNLARAQLATGDFINGWVGHELRKGGTKKAYETLGVKKEHIWDGARFDDTLVVHGEQGIGDEILYSSIFFDLTNFHKDLTITTDDRLMPIMKRSFPGINFISRYNKFFIDKKKSPKHILAGSLGRIFRNSLVDFKKNKTYWLVSSPKKYEEFKKKFSNLKKIKIGISWKSYGIKNQDRNISLAKLVKNFSKKNFDIINLQYGDTSLERNFIEEKIGRKLVHFDNFDYKNDLEGLAALICNCDLIVSIPNAIAHLSGALGKNTWVLCSADTQWYWYSKSKKSFWYPSSRLFKQNTREEWDYIFNLMKKEINKLFE